MNYAIKILEEEKTRLEKCLNEWESENYQEAKKEREKRLNDINNLLELWKQNN